MPLSQPAQDLKDLYAAIIAYGKGEGVASAGHKGRQVAYANRSLKDLIDLYRLLWTDALGTEAGVPPLNELGSSNNSRGLIRMRPIA